MWPPQTTVVVPCYNEAARLPSERYVRFAERQEDVQLLLVDDGSTDSTAIKLHELCLRSNGRIRMHQLATNQGKAEAVRQGISAALDRQPQPDFVGYWDADLATPLEEIPRFVRVLQEHKSVQIVLGTRLPLLGRKIRRSTLRSGLGRLFASVASMGLPVRIRDTQCGAKLLRSSPELAASVAEPFLARWIFDVEMLVRLLRAFAGEDAQSLIYEQPLEQWDEVGGSRLKASDFAKAPLELLAIFWKYRRPIPFVRPGDGNDDSQPAKRAA